MAFREGLRNFFMGTPGTNLQFQRFTPQQQDLQSQGIQQLLGLLKNNMSGLGQGFDFKPIAQQARTQFQTQTVPMLAERFASLGSNRGSSGLTGQLSSAGAGLEEGLAALQSKYNLAQGGQQNQLLSLLLSLATQPSFENAYRPATPGLLGSLAGGVGQAAGSFASLPLYQYLGLL